MLRQETGSFKCVVRARARPTDIADLLQVAVDQVIWRLRLLVIRPRYRYTDTVEVAGRLRELARRFHRPSAHLRWFEIPT